MSVRHRIRWIDGGREPTQAPDPRYPNGIDLVGTGAGETLGCKVGLPYPAVRIGHYVVTCTLCGLAAAATTAGRPDDPRSITLACKRIPDHARRQSGTTRDA